MCLCCVCEYFCSCDWCVLLHLLVRAYYCKDWHYKCLQWHVFSPDGYATTCKHVQTHTPTCYMCVYICIHAHARTNPLTVMHTHTHTYTRMCVCVYACVCVSTFVRVYIYMCVYIGISLHTVAFVTFTHAHIFMHVSVHTNLAVSGQKILAMNLMTTGMLPKSLCLFSKKALFSRPILKTSPTKWGGLIFVANPYSDPRVLTFDCFTSAYIFTHVFLLTYHA